ncbi:7005_t:CDS:2, partial [Scutellospora calospora]
GVFECNPAQTQLIHPTTHSFPSVLQYPVFNTRSRVRQTAATHPSTQRGADDRELDEQTGCQDKNHRQERHK